MNWYQFSSCDYRARILADNHYSRQTIGAKRFLPPGKNLLLMTLNFDAIWGVMENLDMAGNNRWRNTIFRNESTFRLSSDLIKEATDKTFKYWSNHYNDLPLPLTTEIDTTKVIKKETGEDVIEKQDGFLKG